MPSFHPTHVSAVAGLLDPGEQVWAVYASSGRPLVITQWRLFVLGNHGPEPHPLTEYRAVLRVSDRMVVLESRDGASMAIPVQPGDEHGLQALTVLGLLVMGDHPDTDPPPGPRAAPSRLPPRRLRRARVRRHRRLADPAAAAEPRDEPPRYRSGERPGGDSSRGGSANPRQQQR